MLDEQLPRLDVGKAPKYNLAAHSLSSNPMRTKMNFTGILSKLAVASLVVVASLEARAQGDPLYNLNQSPYSDPSSSFEFATSPSLASFNSTLYIAFTSNDGTNTVNVTSTTNGTTFTGPTSLSVGAQSGTAPAIAVFNNQLWLAYVGTNGDLYTAYSSNGTSFSAPILAQYEVSNDQLEPIVANSSPTLAVYNSQLWIGVVQYTSGSKTSVDSFIYQTNGYFKETTICGTSPDGALPQVGAAVGMAVFNNLLYYAYQSQGGEGGHTLYFCSTNGSSSSYYRPQSGGSYIQVGGGVSAAVWGGSLYFNYKAYNSHNLTITEVAADDSSTTNDYSTLEINGNQEINPSAGVLGTTYYVAFTQNNSGHHLTMTEN